MKTVEMILTGAAGIVVALHVMLLQMQQNRRNNTKWTNSLQCMLQS